MTAPSQREIINDMQVQLARVDTSLEYLKKQADSTDRKLDLAIDSISHLAFLPIARFEEYQHMLEGWRQTTERRIKHLEDYNSKNSLGVRFSNDIVTNIFKTLAAVAAAGLLVAAGYLSGSH